MEEEISKEDWAIVRQRAEEKGLRLYYVAGSYKVASEEKEEWEYSGDLAGALIFIIRWKKKITNSRRA